MATNRRSKSDQFYKDNFRKKKPNHQERTYIVESGRPASHTKSSTARSSNSGHIPMAEMIYRDQTRLPDRFRYKPVEVVQVTLTRTVPVSPMLHTYARKVSFV